MIDLFDDLKLKRVQTFASIKCDQIRQSSIRKKNHMIHSITFVFIITKKLNHNLVFFIKQDLLTCVNRPSPFVPKCLAVLYSHWFQTKQLSCKSQQKVMLAISSSETFLAIFVSLSNFIFWLITFIYETKFFFLLHTTV